MLEYMRTSAITSFSTHKLARTRHARLICFVLLAPARQGHVLPTRIVRLRPCLDPVHVAAAAAAFPRLPGFLLFCFRIALESF